MILRMHDTYSSIFLVIEIWLGLLRGRGGTKYMHSTNNLRVQRKETLTGIVSQWSFLFIFFIMSAAWPSVDMNLGNSLIYKSSSLNDATLDSFVVVDVSSPLHRFIRWPFNCKIWNTCIEDYFNSINVSVSNWQFIIGVIFVNVASRCPLYFFL